MLHGEYFVEGWVHLCQKMGFGSMLVPRRHVLEPTCVPLRSMVLYGLLHAASAFALRRRTQQAACIRCSL